VSTRWPLPYGAIDASRVQCLDLAIHRNELERTLREHGFAVEAMAGINPVDPSASWSRRLAKRAAIAFLGADTRFLQFGFRARLGAT